MNYFLQAWRMIALSASIGLAIGLLFALVQESSFQRQWRAEQERIAIGNLAGLRLYLLARFEDLEVPFDPNRLDAKTREAIDTFCNGQGIGEPHWSIQLDPELESSAARANGMLDQVRARWFPEPASSQRLRMAIGLDPRFMPYRELDVSKRFSGEEVAAARPAYWPWVLAFAMAGLLTGMIRSRVTYEHLTLANWLEHWSTRARLSDYSTATDANPDFGLKLGDVEHRLTSIIHYTTQAVHQQRIEVQAAADRSAHVLSAMPVGVLSFNEDLKLIYVNRAGRELLDLNPQFQFGQTLIEVIRQPTVVNLVQRARSENQLQEVELEMNVSKIILRLRAYPLAIESIGPKPQNYPVLLTVSDETRLKQLENARRDFTANVSHELKTPLSAIKAYAETLLMGAIEDRNSNRRFVECISDQAQRLDQLIRDLLHLTRLQSQPGKIELVPILIADVLRTCVEEHRPIASQRRITIDVEVVDPERRVDADFESLRTIISNLLSNAVRYSSPDGHVLVRSRDEGNVVIFSIRDQGIGIPEEDLERIFERFYRVEKARSQDAGGTGLGLAIVKHLVHAIGGQIHVESQLGSGSTFELRLNRSS